MAELRCEVCGAVVNFEVFSYCPACENNDSEVEIEGAVVCNVC